MHHIIYFDFSNVTFNDTFIYICPSCGKNHMVDCLPLKSSIMIDGETWTHYYICPETNESVNIKIELK